MIRRAFDKRSGLLYNPFKVVQYSSRYYGFEDGPKNPSTGTSMKFLVLAADAQSGADAGS